jgi:hypothetical protein
MRHAMTIVPPTCPPPPPYRSSSWRRAIMITHVRKPSTLPTTIGNDTQQMYRHTEREKELSSEQRKQDALRHAFQLILLSERIQRHRHLLFSSYYIQLRMDIYVLYASLTQQRAFVSIYLFAALRFLYLSLALFSFLITRGVSRAVL